MDCYSNANGIYLTVLILIPTVWYWSETFPSNSNDHFLRAMSHFFCATWNIIVPIRNMIQCIITFLRSYFTYHFGLIFILNKLQYIFWTWFNNFFVRLFDLNFIRSMYSSHRLFSTNVSYIFWAWYQSGEYFNP